MLAQQSIRVELFCVRVILVSLDRDWNGRRRTRESRGQQVHKKSLTGTAVTPHAGVDGIRLVRIWCMNDPLKSLIDPLCQLTVQTFALQCIPLELRLIQPQRRAENVRA